MNRHPWHPVIVHFPIACWIIGTALDLGGQFFSLPPVPGVAWASLSHLLLWTGVVVAVPAMLAGIVDFAGAHKDVQDSTELLWHITAMGSAWTIFLGAAVWRVRAAAFDAPATPGVTLLELLGSICLVAGGYLASIVVYERMPAANARPAEDPDS